ncbi:MAG: ferrochelatase [Acidobacteria bacterium]|nr:ferrochelatase [Acidobacteriota bacterium]
MSQSSPEPINGVLLLAHGGPDSLEDIEPFLRNIRGGRGFSRKLLEDITDRYRQIGGRSPLLDISRRQAQALERELSSKGRFRVYLGMRNWHPFIRETMEEIQRDGVTRLLAICLAPQNSRMSVGQYFEHVQQAKKELNLPVPVTFVESYHREPLLIDAFAEKLQRAITEFSSGNGCPAPVIFTAHSLPEKILSNGDPYDSEVRETAAAVAARCGLVNWRFAYQSQGATAEPWLGPKVEPLIEEISSSECERVLIAPIGFVADHVEVLWDIDIYFRRFARERGVELRRTESLNDSPAFIHALAEVVLKAET